MQIKSVSWVTNNNQNPMTSLLSLVMYKRRWRNIHDPPRITSKAFAASYLQKGMFTFQRKIKTLCFKNNFQLIRQRVPTGLCNPQMPKDRESIQYPTWVTGSQQLEPSLAASHGVCSQEAGLGSGTISQTWALWNGMCAPKQHLVSYVKYSL